MHFTTANEKMARFEVRSGISLLPLGWLFQRLDELELAHRVVEVPDLILCGFSFLFHNKAV